MDMSETTGGEVMENTKALEVALGKIMAPLDCATLSNEEAQLVEGYIWNLKAQLAERDAQLAAEWNTGEPNEKGEYLVWYEYWHFGTMTGPQIGYAKWDCGWDYVHDNDNHAETVLMWKKVCPPTTRQPTQDKGGE